MTLTLGTRPVSSVGLATNWRLSTIDNQTHPDGASTVRDFCMNGFPYVLAPDIFHSCIFHHCYLLLLFPLLHIPPVRSTPASSTSAISTPAVFSCSFHSCIFHSRIFSAPFGSSHFISQALPEPDGHGWKATDDGSLCSSPEIQHLQYFSN